VESNVFFDLYQLFWIDTDLRLRVLKFLLKCKGVQKNRVTEKTEKTDGKLTEKTEP